MATETPLRDRMNAALKELATASKQQEATALRARPQGAGREATVAQGAPNISDNPVYAIMADNGVSNEEKIRRIADYLTAKDENYESARAHFAEFEAYFAHVQAEGVQVDMEGIRGLIAEVQGQLKPEIEKIVHSIVEVQRGVDESKNMLEVLRAARVRGTTVDEIKVAIELNDRVVAEIGKLAGQIKELEERQRARKVVLDRQLDAKIESQTGFVNRMKRILGPDREIANAVDAAQARLEQAQEELSRTTELLKAKQAARDQQLESGPLTILRSIDATEEGFAKNLVATANNSLSLLEQAIGSIRTLLARTVYSKKAAYALGETISQAEVREAILKGTVQHAAQAARSQSETIKARLSALDQAIAAAQARNATIEVATLSAERVALAELQKGALGYEDSLHRTHEKFEVIAANSVEAQARAREFAELIETEQGLLERLSTQALPTTARALRMVLEQGMAQQTGLLAESIRAVTKRARDITQNALQDLVKTQAEMHDEDLKHMQAAIDALTEAEKIVVQNVEDTVRQTGERRNLMGGLKGAADELREVLEGLDTLRADASAGIAGSAASRPGANSPADNTEKLSSVA